MTRARAAALILAAVLPLVACDRPPPRPEGPTMALSAEALAFDLPADGVSFPAARSVAIRNAGSGTLAVPMPSITLAAYQAPAGAPDGWLEAAVVAEAGGYRLVVQPVVQSGNCFLPVGDYVATVTLDSPGAVNSPRNVRVTFRVPPPALAPLPGSLTFTAPLDGTDPPEQVLELRSLGGYAPPTAAVLGVASWLRIRTEPVPGTFRSRLVVGVVGAGDPGRSEMSISVSLPGAQATAAEISVVLDVPPAHLRLTPPSLRFTAYVGTTSTQQRASLVNEGRPVKAAPFFDMGLPPAWLELSMLPAGADHEVVVVADARDLAPGTYTATISILLDGADNSPLRLPIELEVLPPPPLPPVLAPGAISFQGPLLGDPAPRVVQVSNPNVGPMPQPTVSVAYGAGAADWLVTSVTGSTAPYALELRASTAGLASGVYSAVVTVSVPGFGEATAPVELVLPDWRFTGPMRQARIDHTATLLADGRVLVAGGNLRIGPTLYEATGRCELYDPATDTWSETGAMGDLRAHHTATRLEDGRVLVAGGEGGTGASTFEVFDPVAGAFTASGPLRDARTQPVAALLADGRVLLAGGGAAERYDPASGATAATGATVEGHVRGAAVRLPSGKVLLAGGLASAGGAGTTSELYDPTTGGWTSTGSMAHGRVDFGLVLLPDGRALAVGGYDGFPMSSAELFDETTGLWTPAADSTGSHIGPAALLPGGKVLVWAWPGNAEVFDPLTGTWSSAGATQIVRTPGTLTVLPDGRILVAGGNDAIGDTTPILAEIRQVIP